MSTLLRDLVEFVRDRYRTSGTIPLHEPRFLGNERAYVVQALDSTLVSSVGPFVDRIETMVRDYTGAIQAVATVNGTAALHVALRLAGVQPGDLVVTQPLTFVATCNAIAYCGAEPLFADVERSTLGLSAARVDELLTEVAELRGEGCVHRASGRRIRACLPMHTFGHPADLDGLARVCDQWGLVLVEDAAEALGSLYRGRHAGTVGPLGALSFNGNKIVTTGGGGMILTRDPDTGRHAKHLTTTAKIPHPYEYMHDEVGYNYRMPNLNAALGCAQLELIEALIAEKRHLAEQYASLFAGSDCEFVGEPPGCRSNYWLNAVVCPDRKARDEILAFTHAKGIMTRPAWCLMTQLPMYGNCPAGRLDAARWLGDRLLNLPSSAEIPTGR